MSNHSARVRKKAAATYRPSRTQPVMGRTHNTRLATTSRLRQRAITRARLRIPSSNPTHIQHTTLPSTRMRRTHSRRTTSGPRVRPI